MDEQSFPPEKLRKKKSQEIGQPAHIAGILSSIHKKNTA